VVAYNLRAAGGVNLEQVLSCGRLAKYLVKELLRPIESVLAVCARLVHRVLLPPGKPGNASWQREGIDRLTFTTFSAYRAMVPSW
jgi:hypothetical protein